MTGMFDKAVIDAISLEEKIYALPISCYHKLLFSKRGLTESSNWDEFIEVCDNIKQNNVSPIYIGSNSNWSATAWFDHLNLQLNGIQFHKYLMRGEASYLDGRVQNVLQKLRYISEVKYFIQDHQNLEWKQGLPLLFRGLTGMSMLGDYAVQDFPEKIIDIENTQKPRITIFTTQAIH
jgi:multiple sugar transport system substrate-binding protein